MCLGLGALLRRGTVAMGAAATAAALVGSSDVAAQDADPDMASALALREIGLRARAVLQDPPQILRRCARSDWQLRAGTDACETLARCQSTFHKALTEAALSWKQTQRIEPSVLGKLSQAADDTEAALQAARIAAVAGAAAVPWGDAMHGASFEHADGTPADASGGSLEAMRGRTVALYFSASWCGPCHRFTPKLVQLYEQARACARTGTAGLEVVLVSWDELSSDRKEYAQRHGMRWLTLPHTQEMRKLADELTLRYDVMSIPSLVIVEISEDGKEARVLSRDGRMDVERGRAPWLTKVLADKSLPSQ